VLRAWSICKAAGCAVEQRRPAPSRLRAEIEDLHSLQASTIGVSPYHSFSLAAAQFQHRAEETRLRQLTAEVEARPAEQEESIAALMREAQILR
jgi:hypothetical protein